MDFDCIYKSYYLDVYHFLCGLSSNKEIAEDITQETFTKALAAIDSYDGRKDIRAWLFTIARNTYFTYNKRTCKIIKAVRYILEDMSDRFYRYAFKRCFQFQVL